MFLVFLLYFANYRKKNQEEAEEDVATAYCYLQVAIAFELYILVLLKTGLIILLLHTMHCCF